MFRSIALFCILLLGTSVPALAEELRATELERNCSLLGDPPDELTREEANLVLRCVSWWEGYLDRLKAVKSATLAKRGVPMEKIDALSDWRSSLLFDGEERLPLEYAEAMTLNRVNDDLRGRIKKHWNDDAIVELAGLIAFQNLSSKFNAALDVPAQGFVGFRIRQFIDAWRVVHAAILITRCHMTKAEHERTWLWTRPFQ